MVSSSSTLLFRILFPKCHVCGRRRRLEANMEQKGRLRRTEKEKKRKWDSSSDLLLFSLLPYGRVAFWMAKWEGGGREEGEGGLYFLRTDAPFSSWIIRNIHVGIFKKYKYKYRKEMKDACWWIGIPNLANVTPKYDACFFFLLPCMEATPLLFLLLLLLLLPRHRQHRRAIK